MLQTQNLLNEIEKKQVFDQRPDTQKWCQKCRRISFPVLIGSRLEDHELKDKWVLPDYCVVCAY